MSVLPVGFGSAAGGTPANAIGRSLRFNSADTPSLSRTPGSAGNRQKFTISVWYKACGISTGQSNANIINAGGDGSSLVISGTGAFGVTYDNRLLFREAGTTLFYWPMVFRDASAWYHIVFAMDTTQATAANRAKLYVNGVDQGAFSGTAISQNTSTSINNTSAHSIGLFNGAYPNNLYYAEYYLIDGQQLAASSFGETDSATGVWKPKVYTGTYGTNGFYVNFSDNSNTTAATLGKDYSGNGNNWTPNNFSVTAGVGNDSLVDSPTSYGTDTGVGGEVRGNYATLNPISNPNGPLFTLSNGNLDYSCSASSGNAPKMSVTSSIAMSSGKWYCEATETSSNSGFGVSSGIISGGTANGPQYAIAFGSGGASSSAATYSGTSPTFTTNDRIGLALDADARTLAIYKNGTLQGTFSGLESSVNQWFFIQAPSASASASSAIWNFGQRAFAYTAPSGFKALCTQNLPTPTIGATSTTQANDYFNAVLWTGNTSTAGVTQAISGVGFQPDFLWAKTRNQAFGHYIYDSIRGVGSSGKRLNSAATTAEATNGEVNSFDSDGFTVKYTDTNVLNWSSSNNVGWAWKAGGTGVSNTAGTITSTVSANTTAGFSISTYTGNGSSSQTVGHGLGVAPGMVIIKTRSNSDNWRVWHTSLTSGQTLTLNSTAAQAASGFWPSNPSTSVVYLGTDSSVNSSTWTYVMYSFAPVAGYSAFGSYVANGSTDGVFVFCGFRPRFFLVKDRTSANDWLIYDTARNPYNLAGLELLPNSSGAEATGNRFDILSNGFKIRGSGGAHNTNGNTYIYAAFAESPFKYSLAR